MSDGKASTSLAPFTLTVIRVRGTATVRWAVPTTTEDDAPLKNLAGFRVVYGTSSNALDQVLELASPELTSVSVEALDAGTYYFAVKAYTRSGKESDPSTVVSKTIL